MIHRTLILSTALAFTACAPDALDSRQASVSQNGLNLDELYLGVDRQVPGFGGLWLCEGGNAFCVYLVESSPEKIAALERILPRALQRPLPPGGIVVRQGSFSWTQLMDWKQLLAENGVHALNVISSDIDERSNRLRYGVLYPSYGLKRRVDEGIDPRLAREEILNLVNALGIPAPAVATEWEHPVVLL